MCRPSQLLISDFSHFPGRPRSRCRRSRLLQAAHLSLRVHHGQGLDRGREGDADFCPLLDRARIERRSRDCSRSTRLCDKVLHWRRNLVSTLCSGARPGGFESLGRRGNPDFLDAPFYPSSDLSADPFHTSDRDIVGNNIPVRHLSCCLCSRALTVTPACRCSSSKTESNSST